MKTKVFSYLLVAAMVFSVFASAGFAGTASETVLTKDEMERLYGAKPPTRKQFSYEFKSAQEVRLNDMTGEELKVFTRDPNQRANGGWGEVSYRGKKGSTTYKCNSPKYIVKIGWYEDKVWKERCNPYQSNEKCTNKH
jgi:hypothetical protein